MPPSKQPIPLTPILTAPGQSEYTGLLNWPFPSAPFYESQILRLLQQDIPHRCLYGDCFVWVFRDPNGDDVAFGTLEHCTEYPELTDGQCHFYIPVLSVHPQHRFKGHGRTVVTYLVEAAKQALRNWPSHGHIFLDVYSVNTNAISLYEKCGWAKLDENQPRLDPDQNNEPFVVMSRALA